MRYINDHIQELNWTETRELIQPLNPEFVTQADKVVDNSFTAYKISYRYGDLISKEGRFRVPADDGTCLDLEDPRNDLALVKNLKYRVTIPMGMSLNKHLEGFMALEDRVFPWGLAKPGSTLGLYSLLAPAYSGESSSCGSMSAGARSVFLVPSIKDTYQHSKIISALDLGDVPAPLSYQDHFFTFRAIAQSECYRDEWRADVIFFSEKWVNSFSKKNFAEFTLYLQTDVWKRYTYFRNLFIHKAVLSQLEVMCNCRPNPYLYATIEHIFAIASRAYPGFSVACNDDALPLDIIQEVYSSVYFLRDYAPIVMQPKHMRYDDPDTRLYYALRYPTLSDFFPRADKGTPELRNLQDIIISMNRLLNKIKENPFGIANTEFSLPQIVQNVEFFYMHQKSEVDKLIEDPNYMLETDPTLQKEMAKFPEKILCENASFFSGVIGFNLLKQNQNKSI